MVMPPTCSLPAASVAWAVSCHAFNAWNGKLATVKSSTVRGQLVEALEEALRLQERLVAEARDPAVSAAELVAQVSVLERLDDRRDKLLGALREEAKAGQRAARSGPSVREVVLAALDEMRWPQNAGFVEEYLWATRQVQLDSRAVAPLRRDERRAWQRAPGARKAYVAPALDPGGSANPRWVTSTAWDLDRRVVASGHSAGLFDLYKIFALAGRPGTSDDARPRKPVDALLEEYAEQLLDIEPPPVSADAEEAAAWRARVRRRANVRIGEVRAQDEPRRKEIAAELASLPEGERFWGRSPRS